MARRPRIIVRPLSPRYTPPKAPTTNPYSPNKINIGDPITYEKDGKILEGIVEGYDDIVVESEFDMVEPGQVSSDISGSQIVENEEVLSALESDQRLDKDNRSIIEYDNETGLLKYQGRPSNKQIQGLLDNFPSPYLKDLQVIFHNYNQRVIADSEHPGLSQYSAEVIEPFKIKPGEPGYVENRTTYNVPIHAQNKYDRANINGNAPTSSFIEDARVEPIYKRLKPRPEYGNPGIDPQLGELIDSQTSLVERFAKEQLGWTLPYNRMELFAKYYMLEKFPTQMLQDFPKDRYPHIHEIKNFIDQIKEVDIEINGDLGFISPAGQGLYPPEVIDRFDGYVKATEEKVVPRPLSNDRTAGRKITSEESSVSYSLQSLTDLQRQRMVGSGRAGGFIGKKPVSWQYAEKILSKNDKVLDYGAGKHARQSQELAEKGYDITPYDLPENQVRGLHDMHALRDRYKYTVASNVLNVQPNPSSVLNVLEEIYDTLEPGGHIIANYPTSPRYSDMTPGAIKQLIKEAGFTSPEIVGGTNQAPVFKAMRPSTKVKRLDEIAEAFIDIKTRDKEETISAAVARGLHDIIDAFKDPTFEMHQTLEWYREAVVQAWDIASIELPIIKESPSHRSLFTAIVASSSQGLAVDLQYEYSIEAFKRHMSDGKFNLKKNDSGNLTLRALNREGVEVTVGGGVSTKAVGENCRKIDALIDQYGFDKAMDWLNTPHSGYELVEFLQSIGFKSTSKISKTQTHYGSKILGPKIARYYDNLMGRHNEAVYDRWFMRMWGRWMGMPFKTNKHGEIFFKDGRPEMKEAPTSAYDWKVMDATVNRLKDILTKATGYSWGVDQVQAVLWYTEKLFWERAGAKPVPGINYLDAAIERAQRKGYIDEFATSESSQRAIRNTLKGFIESKEGNRFLERGAGAIEPYITKKIKDDVTFSIRTGGRVEPAIFTSSIPDAIDKIESDHIEQQRKSWEKGDKSKPFTPTPHPGLKYKSYDSFQSALTKKGASKNELLWVARLPFWLEAQGYKIGDRVPLSEIREYVDGLTNIKILDMTEPPEGARELGDMTQEIAEHKSLELLEPAIEVSDLNIMLESLSDGLSLSDAMYTPDGKDIKGLELEYENPEDLIESYMLENPQVYGSIDTSAVEVNNAEKFTIGPSGDYNNIEVIKVPIQFNMTEFGQSPIPLENANAVIFVLDGNPIATVEYHMIGSGRTELIPIESPSDHYISRDKPLATIIRELTKLVDEYTYSIFTSDAGKEAAGVIEGSGYDPIQSTYKQSFSPIGFSSQTGSILPLQSTSDYFEKLIKIEHRESSLINWGRMTTHDSRGEMLEELDIGRLYNPISTTKKELKYWYKTEDVYETTEAFIIEGTKDKGFTISPKKVPEDQLGELAPIKFPTSELAEKHLIEKIMLFRAKDGRRYLYKNRVDDYIYVGTTRRMATARHGGGNYIKTRHPYQEPHRWEGLKDLTLKEVASDTEGVAAHMRGFSAIDHRSHKHLQYVETQASVKNLADIPNRKLSEKLDEHLGITNSLKILKRGDQIFWKNPIVPSHKNAELEKLMSLVRRTGDNLREVYPEIEPGEVNNVLAVYGLDKTGKVFDLKALSPSAKNDYVELIKQMHKLDENRHLFPDYKLSEKTFGNWYLKKIPNSKLSQRDKFIEAITATASVTEITQAAYLPIQVGGESGTAPVQNSMDFMNLLTPVILRDIYKKRPRYLSVTNGILHAISYGDGVVRRVSEGTIFYRKDSSGQIRISLDAQDNISEHLNPTETVRNLKEKLGPALTKKIKDGEFDEVVKGSRDSVKGEAQDTNSHITDFFMEKMDDNPLELNLTGPSGYEKYGNLSPETTRWTDPLRQRYYHNQSDKYYFIEMIIGDSKLTVARFGSADRLWNTPGRLKASFKKYTQQHLRDYEYNQPTEESPVYKLRTEDNIRDFYSDFNALSGEQVRQFVGYDDPEGFKKLAKKNFDILANRYDGTNLVQEVGDITTYRWRGDIGQADQYSETLTSLGRAQIQHGSDTHYSLVWQGLNHMRYGNTENFLLSHQRLMGETTIATHTERELDLELDIAFEGMYYRDAKNRIEDIYTSRKNKVLDIADKPWLAPVVNVVDYLISIESKTDTHEWLGINIPEPIWTGAGIQRHLYGDPYVPELRRSPVLDRIAKDLKKLTGVEVPIVDAELGHIDANSPKRGAQQMVQYLQDAGEKPIDATGAGAKNHFPIKHLSLDLKKLYESPEFEKLGDADITFSLGDGSREQLPDSDYGDLYKTPEESFERPELTHRYKRDKRGGIVSEMFIPISTRLRRINPVLETVLRRFVYNSGVKTVDRFETVEAFKKKVWKKFKRSQRDVLNLALLNSDMKKVDELINTLPEGQRKGVYKSFTDIRNLLDNIRREGIEVGYEIGEIVDYFPRWIKDYDGLVEMLSKDEKSRGIITDALLKAEEKVGRELTQEEKSNVVNNVIRGTGPQTGVAPGSTKERVIEVLDKDMVRYYNSAMDAIIRHVQNWTEAIERQRLFGKGDRTGDDIADAVSQMMEEGVVGPDQQGEVVDIIRAFFNTTPTSSPVATTKAILYAYTMGSVSSAITQLGDMAWSLHHAGLPRTLMGIAKAAIGKGQVKMEDVGITNIATELSSLGGLNKYLDKQFKIIGLAKMDRLFKNTLIEASLLKHQGYAKKITSGKRFLILDKAKKSEFYTRMVELFGEDKAVTVIQDLARGKITEDIKFLLFSDLLDYQPAARTEVPQAYLNAPNGRIAYMLKTFTLKQLDAYRRQGYDKIRSGYQQIGEGNAKSGSKTVALGIASLIHIMAMFLLTQTGANKTKDWAMGRDNDLDDAFFDALWNVFGLSRFMMYQYRRFGFATSAQDVFLPPLKSASDKVERDIKKINKWWEGKNSWDATNLELPAHVPMVDMYNIPAKAMNWILEDKTVPYIPAGKMYYWWFGGGKVRSLDREMDTIVKKSQEGYDDMGDVNAALTLLNQNLMQQVDLGSIGEADRMIKIKSFLDNVRNTFPQAIKESFDSGDVNTETELRDLHTKVVERMLELNLIDRTKMGTYKRSVSRSKLNKIKSDEEKKKIKEEKTEEKVEQFLEAEDKI